MESIANLHECIHCKILKQRDEFGTRAETGNRVGTCKACIKRLTVERKANPEFVPRRQRYDNNDGTRTCRMCDVAKPIDEFPLRGRNTATRRNECSSCWCAVQRERYKQNRELARHNMRKLLYGIDQQAYEDLMASQGGVCAICGERETSPDRRTGKPRGLFVDHCHSTGRVRGLLCMRCNMGIGQFRDRTDLLTSAIMYLDT